MSKGWCRNETLSSRITPQCYPSAAQLVSGGGEGIGAPSRSQSVALTTCYESAPDPTRLSSPTEPEESLYCWDYLHSKSRNSLVAFVN